MILPTSTDIARQRRDDMVAAATRSRLVRDARAARRARSTDTTTTARRSPLRRLVASLRPRPVAAPAPTERSVATATTTATAATPDPEPLADDRSSDRLVGCGPRTA